MANLDGNYSEAIERVAKDVIENVAEGYDESEQIEQWADSLTTYTSDAVRIISETRNDEAILDSGVYDITDLGVGLDSITQLYTRIAFFAVSADIRDEIARLADNDEEEGEDD